MLDHFLALGGNEVVNSARSYGYATTADCAVEWLRDPECDTLVEAEFDTPYDYANIAAAPWYDPDDPDTTSRFYGLYGIDILNLSDSTRSAVVNEKTGPGAVVSGYRQGSREIRVRGWLTAAGEDAMEYGMTWLSRVLEPNACGQHGGLCGEADMRIWVACPPDRNSEPVPGLYPYPELYPSEDLFPNPGTLDPTSDAAYLIQIAPYRRYLHSVRCISGPFVTKEKRSRNGIHVGRLVEFTLLAEVPFVYGEPVEVSVPPLVPTIVQDTVYNLAPYPSAELAGPEAVTRWLEATGPSGAKLTIPTPASPPGGQTTHPSVVDFGSSPFHGYRYWMAHTPYYNGDDSYEDPCIVASNNGTNWVVPPGLTNPLDDKPGSPGPYNSDVDLVYGPDGYLWLFWRTYDSSSTGTEEKLFLRRSADGITWTSKVLIWVTDSSVMRMLSPSFIYESGAWTMWAVDIVGGHTVRRVRSSGPTLTSPSDWGTPTACTVPSTGFLRGPWHIEVRWIDGQYIGLLNDALTSGTLDHNDLYVITSTDGITFQLGPTVAIPRSGTSGSSTYDTTYRATLTRKSASQLDVWYAAYLDHSPPIWNMWRTTLTAPQTGGVPIYTNYTTNPSLESNMTGWSGTEGGGIAPGGTTGARVTGIFAVTAVGTASYQRSFLPSSAGTAGYFSVTQTPGMSNFPTTPGTRVSLTMWAAAVVEAGTPVLGTLEFIATWLTGSTVIGTQNLGSVPTSGGSVDVASVLPPAGADNVIIEARLNMTSWSSGDIIRLYGDALAVMVP